MRKWFKPQLLVMLLSVLAALIALPFSSTAYAAQGIAAQGQAKFYDNIDVQPHFQVDATSNLYVHGDYSCPEGVNPAASVDLWVIREPGGQLAASASLPSCDHSVRPYTLNGGGANPGFYHLWVNCHTGGCGHNVTVNYVVEGNLPAAAPAPTPQQPTPPQQQPTPPQQQPTPTPSQQQPSIPLYRLWNPNTGHHFYTTSASERDDAERNGKGYIIREGVAAYVFNSQIANSLPLHRLWNPKTGDHLYTISDQESNQATQNGYEIEAPAAYVFSSQIANSLPLYRLWNPNTHDHFYTTSPEERDQATHHGYGIEGPACYVYPTPVDSTPLYNLGDPNTGDHFYTTSASELKQVTSKGYIYLGIAAYVFSSQIAKSVPLYRLWNPKTGDHLYTMSTEERDQATKNGSYKDEGPACYVYPTQINNSVPLHRLWNPTAGYHFYTTSEYEVTQETSNRGGYKDEGPAAYVLPA